MTEVMYLLHSTGSCTCTTRPQYMAWKSYLKSTLKIRCCLMGSWRNTVRLQQPLPNDVPGYSSLCSLWR